MDAEPYIWFVVHGTGYDLGAEVMLKEGGDSEDCLVPLDQFIPNKDGSISPLKAPRLVLGMQDTTKVHLH